MLEILSHVSYTHKLDQLSWRWKNSGKFTVKSLYKLLNYKGKLPIQPMLWWNVPVPLKIRILMLLTNKKRILTKDQLLKREAGRVVTNANSMIISKQ